MPAGVDKNSLYRDVEYVSGHESFAEKKSGQIAVTTDGVTFFNKKGDSSLLFRSAAYKAPNTLATFGARALEEASPWRLGW